MLAKGMKSEVKMFNDKYGFLIEDLERKLQLIQTDKEIKLIKGDLKDLVFDLLSDIGQQIGLLNIENKLDAQQKIDVDCLLSAAKVFNKEEYFSASFSFAKNKKLIFKDLFEHLQKSLNTIKQNEIKLGRTEILFRLEMGINGLFQQLLFILGNNAPHSELQAMAEEKLNTLSDEEIRVLWGRVVGEFKDDDLGFGDDHSLASQKYLLGDNFLKCSDQSEMRVRIAKYATHLRPKIIRTRLENGIMTSPIFFGLARILAIHGKRDKELTLDEITLLRILQNFFSFFKDVFYEEKNVLCSLLGIPANGRIASITPRDLDNDLDNSSFDFRRDRMRSYSIILLDLKRLLRIADALVGTRPKNEHPEKSQQSQKDIVDVKPNFCGLGVNLNALWKQKLIPWWKNLRKDAK